VDDSLFVIKIISTTVRFFQPSLFIALKAILLNAEDAERRRERKNGAKECGHCEAGVRAEAIPVDNSSCKSGLIYRDEGDKGDLIPGK
jgi:hypothetical protein